MIEKYRTIINNYRKSSAKKILEDLKAEGISSINIRSEQLEKIYLHFLKKNIFNS